MDYLFRHLHVDPSVAIEFIAVFSRCEYALKAVGFLEGDEKQVTAAWDRFANEVHGDFTKGTDAEVSEAVEYMLKTPPKKQVILGGLLTFVDQHVDEKQKTTQQLFRFVRTVRNNLFHGGKYVPSGEIEAGRNAVLISHSMTILRYSMMLRPDVELIFQA